jgi:hypothetical protein
MLMTVEVCFDRLPYIGQAKNSFPVPNKDRDGVQET